MKNFLSSFLFSASVFLLTPVLAQAEANSDLKGSFFNKLVLADGFVVSGTVQGLGDGSVRISTLRGDQTLVSTKAKADQFTLKGSIPEPGLYWLTLGTAQARYIFLEKANIKVTGAIANIKNIKIEGSSSQKDFEVFESTFNPLFAKLNATAQDLNKGVGNRDQLMNSYKQAIAALDTEIEKFVAARPSSYVSLFLLSVTMQAAENMQAADRRFQSLNAAVRNSVAGKELGNNIAYSKIGSIGSDAIDFTQNDVTDKPVSLSSFRGKYVLVDFWASWCKPCRQENPNVVKVYNKFKDKNFTVLGISLDQQKDAWVKAIEKDNLTWTNLSDLQLWSNAVAQLYRVQSIPQNFLIDPSGKIVAKDLRGEDLEKTLCSFLKCSN